jgi:hypothetical protein
MESFLRAFGTIHIQCDEHFQSRIDVSAGSQQMPGAPRYRRFVSYAINASLPIMVRNLRKQVRVKRGQWALFLTLAQEMGSLFSTRQTERPGLGGREGEMTGSFTSGNCGHALCAAFGQGCLHNPYGVDWEFVLSGKYEFKVAGE